MWLEPVRRALDAAHETTQFFFRDDDAGWQHLRLSVLLDVFEDADVPVDLAVIPFAIDEALADDLGGRRQRRPGKLGLHQHGFAHLNHERAGRKCEFGPSRSPHLQARDIVRGHGRLVQWLGRVDPIFTPPWNRCTQATADFLAQIGVRALSRNTGAVALDLHGMGEISVAVDWSRYACDRAALGNRIADSIESAEGPVGIMLHHAAMSLDDIAMTEDLLRLLGGHARARCLPMHRLLEPAALAAEAA